MKRHSLTTALVSCVSTLLVCAASSTLAAPSRIVQEPLPEEQIEQDPPEKVGGPTLDDRVRRVLVELLIERPTAEPRRDTAQDRTETGDEELRASVRRVLRQLLGDSARTKPKPIRTAAGVPVESVEMDADEPAKPELLPDAPEATMVAQAQEAEDDAERERSRTVYDEAPDLIQSVERVTFGGFVQMALNNFFGDHPTVGEYEIPRATRRSRRRRRGLLLSDLLGSESRRSDPGGRVARILPAPRRPQQSRTAQGPVQPRGPELGSLDPVLGTSDGPAQPRPVPRRGVQRVRPARSTAVSNTPPGSSTAPSPRAPPMPGRRKRVESHGKRLDCSGCRSLKASIWAPPSPIERSTARWPPSTTRRHLTRPSSGIGRIRARTEV